MSGRPAPGAAALVTPRRVRLAAYGSLILAALPARALPGQDTTRAGSGVRVGITYTPGVRPSLAVLALPGVDSARAILERDLDESDRFEMLPRPAAPADTSALAAPGAAYRVVVTGAPAGRAAVEVLDGRTGASIFQRTVDPAARWPLHRTADDIVRTITGQEGIAATRLLFVLNGRLALIDADGYGYTPLRSAGFPSLSPAWSPDGRFVAYTAFVPSGQPIVIQDLETGERDVVPGTETGLNITPAFSRDGRRLAFAHGTEDGMDLYIYQVTAGGERAGLARGAPAGAGTEAPRDGALTRLTISRYSDDLSPTWSPDGTRIAFISDRAGTPQLYVMSSDGTGREVLASFDYGATGTTSAPDWSPDGRLVAFHREVAGVPQLFVVDVETRAVRQLTGSGRNEDPTWAPDSRHLCFVSSRSGARELWILDLETGRLRQLTRLAGARLPAWSPRRATSAGGGGS